MSIIRSLRSLFATFIGLLLIAGPASAATIDPALLTNAKRAADNGLHYLRQNLDEDGSWSGSVGITALGLRAFLENRRGYNEDDGPFITKPIAFILNYGNEDGSISETNFNRNYNTAVVISALQATGNDKYADVIKNGQHFLGQLQLTEKDGYDPSHKYYGGIGYGGDERPDLSNVYFALEALKATGFDQNDPLWQRATTFVTRSQNNSETNDLDWAGNDGGFAYMPGYSPHGGAVSYGGMSHAGLISLLFAGVDKEDPRVKAVYEWIKANYTLENNPGAKKKQGLFYYYNAFAKSMYAFGEAEITDSNGVTHNWREELTRQLLNMQATDGSWVNSNSGRWWEGDKNLVTAWSVIALNHVIRKP